MTHPQATDAMIEAACKARYPRIFGDDPVEAHRAASPWDLEAFQAQQRAEMKLALTAALQAAPQGEVVAWAYEHRIDGEWETRVSLSKSSPERDWFVARNVRPLTYADTPPVVPDIEAVVEMAAQVALRWDNITRGHHERVIAKDIAKAIHTADYSNLTPKGGERATQAVNEALALLGELLDGPSSGEFYGLGKDAPSRNKLETIRLALKRGEHTGTPTPAPDDDGLVEELKDLLGLMEDQIELNPSNYDYDDACRLNSEAVEIYDTARGLVPRILSRLQGKGD